MKREFHNGNCFDDLAGASERRVPIPRNDTEGVLEGQEISRYGSMKFYGNRRKIEHEEV